MLVIIGVVGLHFGSVQGALDVALPLQFLGVGLVVASIERWWGGAQLPLSLGRVGPSLRLTGKVLLAAALIVVVIALIELALARIGGMRWNLRPGYAPPMEVFPMWIVVSVIWAPLIEETLYRGFLQARLVRLVGRRPAILFSSLVFWVLHWVMRGQIALPQALLAGVFLATIYDRTRSLLAPMLLHALLNLAIIGHTYVMLRYADAIERALGW